MIPNAVRADELHPVDAARRAAQRVAFGLDPTRPTVVYVGALVPEKGVDLAISAMARLGDAQLLIAGEGPARGALEDQARRVTAQRVVFTSTVASAVDAYTAADVVVLPSRGGDSMPAVLIEAGLMGLPAVATPIEAIPEIVVAGITGLLVPVDDPAALADALRALIDDDDRRARLGAAAREHCIEHFSIEQVATMWAAALQEIVRKRKRKVQDCKRGWVCSSRRDCCRSCSQPMKRFRSCSSFGNAMSPDLESHHQG